MSFFKKYKIDFFQSLLGNRLTLVYAVLDSFGILLNALKLFNLSARISKVNWVMPQRKRSDLNESPFL